MEVVVPLEESSQGDAYTYDADAHTLEIRLTKEVQGTYYPGLDTLRPQVLSETEMAAFEKDAEREADADTPAEHTPDVQGYPTGLLCGSLQVPAYAAIAASGRVPFLDIVNPSDVALPDRAAMAEEIECDKWDEGMFLDTSVDIDDEVAMLLKQTPVFGSLTTDVAPGPLPDAGRAMGLLAQILFAYLYEDRTSLHDPTPESAWTICKLARSLACWVDPLDTDEAMHATMRGLWRRALTHPLYRSLDLCAQTCKDAASLLATDARARILHVLNAIDGIFALAPEGTGLPEHVTVVLQLVWDMWLAPLQTFVAHALTDDQLSTLHRAFTDAASTSSTWLEAVGTPGAWSLEALHAAAVEARLHDEGGFV